MSDVPVPGEKLAESTPKPAPKSKGAFTGENSDKSKRAGAKSDLSTPSHLEMSAYNKTPNFKEMDTPRLKSEVGRFGLKPLSKKRAVAKLEEIHR